MSQSVSFLLAFFPPTGFLKLAFGDQAGLKPRGLLASASSKLTIGTLCVFYLLLFLVRLFKIHKHICTGLTRNIWRSETTCGSWFLETELRSSELATSFFTCWAIRRPSCMVLGINSPWGLTQSFEEILCYEFDPEGHRLGGVWSVYHSDNIGYWVNKRRRKGKGRKHDPSCAGGGGLF